MEEEKLTDISMKGAPACGRCHMLVARYAPQVVASTGTSTATGTATRSARHSRAPPDRRREASARKGLVQSGARVILQA
jgi:cytochrome c peroxidase